VVQEDRWFADTNMASKLDIGSGSTYCTIWSDMSIAWEHTFSPGIKEFVCAVWRRDKQYQDCGQAVWHGMTGEELKLASYSNAEDCCHKLFCIMTTLDVTWHK